VALSDETYNKIMDKIARPQSNLSLIELLRDHGDTGSLIKACLKSLETSPDDIAVRKILAEIYLEQGYAGLAEGEIDTICRNIDEMSKIYKVRAKLYKKEGRFAEAIESLQLYSAHCPDDQEAHGLLSELVANAGEEKSVLITPTMAEIYFKQGEIEEAMNIYREIVKAFPDDKQYRTRLNELEGMNAPQKVDEGEKDNTKEKKLKLISTLEKWLDILEKRKALST